MKFEQEPVSAAMKEDELQALLMTIPKVLRDEWVSLSDEMEIDDALIFVRDKIAKRKSAEEVLTRIHEIKNKEIKEEVRSVVGDIATTFGNGDFFVGNGTVAEVYEMPHSEHVCVKYLVNPSMAREHGNNFQEELTHLEEVASLVVDGVRAPFPYFYHSSDSGTCFGMEKIQGLSFSRIIENPAAVQFLNVIRKQDEKDVVGRYRNYVKALHSDAKKVHRDLTPRNLMVDKDGNWFVIDFGRAKNIEIGDDSTDLSEASDIPTVENAVRSLFKAIREFDKNNNM